MEIIQQTLKHTAWECKYHIIIIMQQHISNVKVAYSLLLFHYGDPMLNYLKFVVVKYTS